MCKTILVGFIVIVMVFMIGCTVHEQNAKVTFLGETSFQHILHRYAGENSSKAMYFAKNGNGILESNWINNNTLRLVVYTGSNCGVYGAIGNVKMKENVLYVHLMLETDNAQYLCNSKYLIEYNITGIPRKDYNITLVES